MAIKDHYKVLGIAVEASETEIKKAYHGLAKKFHPDKNSDDGAEEKFKEIAAAYETLKDTDNRRLYNLQRRGEEDRAKRAKEEANRPKNTTGSSTTFSFNSGGPGFTFRSNFSTFGTGTDAPKPNKYTSQSETDRGKPKKTDSKFGNSRQYRASSKTSRPDWDQDFSSEYYTNSSKKDDDDPAFTFTFDYFKERRKKPDDPFKHFERNFETFFSSTRFNNDPLRNTFKDFFGYGSEEQRSRGRPKSANKKPKGDMDDDMWNWSKPMFNKGKHSDDLDYDSDDDYMFKQPCTYCRRSFNPSSLKSHEAVCKKWYSGSQSSRFDDEDEDDGPSPRSRNWRQEHEDLLRNMKNAREASRAQRESQSPPPRRTGDYITCKYCSRVFHKSAAKQHMAFCTVRTETNTADTGGTSSGAPKPPPRATQRDSSQKSYERSGSTANTDESNQRGSNKPKKKKVPTVTLR